MSPSVSTLWSLTVSMVRGLGFFDSASGLLVCGRLAHLLVERAVALMRDQRQPFGYSGADAARVVEVVMAVHELRQRLAGDRLTRLRNSRECSLLILLRLDEGEVVVE